MIHPALSPGEVAQELATLTRERNDALAALAQWRDECLRHRRAELQRVMRLAASAAPFPPTVS